MQIGSVSNLYTQQIAPRAQSSQPKADSPSNSIALASTQSAIEQNISSSFYDKQRIESILSDKKKSLDYIYSNEIKPTPVYQKSQVNGIINDMRMLMNDELTRQQNAEASNIYFEQRQRSFLESIKAINNNSFAGQNLNISA